MKSNENITFYKQNFISRSMTTDDSIDMEVDSNENIEHPEMYKEQNFDDTTDIKIDKNENILNPESNEEQNTFEQLMIEIVGNAIDVLAKKNTELVGKIVNEIVDKTFELNKYVKHILL